VAGYIYLPGKGNIVEYDDRVFANTYTQQPPKAIKAGAEAAGAKLVDHVAWLYPDPHEYNIILDFLAYVIQNPGEKINWALLLQGVHGNGKTFFADMMRGLLGSRNIMVPTTEVISSNFTSWAEAKQFILIEEIRAKGKNRFEIAEKLKTPISNSTVTIHPKNKNPYETINVASFMALSNYKDCIAIQDSSRRYAILMSDIQHKEQIEERGGDEYFDGVWKLLENPGRLRYWFLNRKIPASFKPKGRAPFTKYKDLAVMLSKNDLDLAIDTILVDEVCGCCDDVVSLSSLILALDQDHGLRVPMSQLIRTLAARDFQSVGQRSISGSKHTLWMRRGLTAEAAVDIFRIKIMRGENDV
jgi:hypothetical protein